jgi:hypothetical protein
VRNLENCHTRATRGDQVAVPGRLELPTFGLGNRCSIRLSYGTNFDLKTLRSQRIALPEFFASTAMPAPSVASARRRLKQRVVIRSTHI